jgi:hypothetical protein
MGIKGKNNFLEYDKKVKMNPELSGNWQGGIILGKGYIYIYNPRHPYSTKAKQVLEGRIIVEHHSGRFLLPNGIVHHINGNKQDNNIFNLGVMSGLEEHNLKHRKIRDSPGRFTS